MIDDGVERTDSANRSPSDERDARSVLPRKGLSEFAVLPYRIDSLISVLLVKPIGAQKWRPPTAPLLWTGARHTSAATAAWLQFGVSGRVHVAPLRTSDGPHRVSVYPLQVSRYAPPPSKRDIVARWFSLNDATAVVDGDFLSVLEILARRILKNSGASNSRPRIRA